MEKASNQEEITKTNVNIFEEKNGSSDAEAEGTETGLIEEIETKRNENMIKERNP